MEDIFREAERSVQADMERWGGMDGSPPTIEILESLDAYTCDLCADLDGTVIPMSQYEPGVTVPPFHPNCRGTTCPHVEDKIGKRAARKEDGEAYYVPADMTYKDWKAAFVDGGEKIN